jgi:hypothetical protein
MNLFDPRVCSQKLLEIADVQKHDVSQIFTGEIALQIPFDFFLLANDFHLVDDEFIPGYDKKIKPGESVKKSDQQNEGKQNVSTFQLYFPVDFFCLDLSPFSPVRSLSRKG